MRRIYQSHLVCWKRDTLQKIWIIQVCRNRNFNIFQKYRNKSFLTTYQSLVHDIKNDIQVRKLKLFGCMLFPTKYMFFPKYISNETILKQKLYAKNVDLTSLPCTLLQVYCNVFYGPSRFPVITDSHLVRNYIRKFIRLYLSQHLYLLRIFPSQ